MSTPIPQEFEPSDYHQKKLAESIDEYEQFKAMSEDELLAAFKADCDRIRTQAEEGIAKKEETKRRYMAMLAKAAKWQPPTPDHEGLKEFMISQLNESIKFDCGGDYYQEMLEGLKTVTVESWKAKKLEDLHWNIDYHTKGNREEIERTQGRNKWLRDLRDSIGANVGG